MDKRFYKTNDIGMRQRRENRYLFPKTNQLVPLLRGDDDLLRTTAIGVQNTASVLHIFLVLILKPSHTCLDALR